MKIAVRGFAGGRPVFDEIVDCEEADLEALVPAQMKRVIHHPRHMIELEFLDEPDVAERFFRFGTDPRGMVMPIGIKS